MAAPSLTLRLRHSVPGFSLELDEEAPLKGVTALFGPSGGGKTTVLRLIAGLERPSAGALLFGDEVWFDAAAGIDMPPHERPVGLMFQDARLFPHLTVAGNLDYADTRSRERADAPSRAEVVSALDLAPLLERRPATLSGGERQRVALGRTLLRRPRLLLLDEPLAALDRSRRADILPYIERCSQLFSLPTIFVSHAIDEVARLADRVIVLSDGRVRANGPAADVLESLDLQPLTGRFEAGVLLEGRIVAHDRRLQLTEVETDGVRLTLPIAEDYAPGAPVRLRILARDVAVATKKPDAVSIRNIVAVDVDEIVDEPESPFAEVFLKLGENRLRARVTRAAVEDLDLRPGISASVAGSPQASRRPR
ncbi:MAG: molybdenum ABC transporter ATP-binding protein, partial [Pseudomonadota bacterium]